MPHAPVLSPVPPSDAALPIPGAAQLAWQQGTTAPAAPDDRPELSPPARRLNVRLLVFLVVAAIAGLLGIDAFHAYQIRRMASLFFTRAEAAREAGDARAHIRHLSQYVRLRPHDWDARVQLALAVDDRAVLEGPKRDSLDLMEHVLRNDEQERPELRERLARRYLEFGRYTDARDHLEELLKTRPERADIQSLVADCWLGEGNAEQASDHLRNAITGAPREFSYYGRLAKVLSHDLQRPEEAEALLTDLVQRHRRDPEALLERARYRRDRGQLDHALIDARNAYGLAPDNRNVLLLAANLVASHTDPAQAEPHFSLKELQARLEQELQTTPDDLELIRTVAQLQVLAGQPEAAEQRLRRAFAAHPDDASLHWLLADVLLRRNDIDAARNELAELQRQRTAPSLAAYLEARISIAEGDWLTARHRLESIPLADIPAPYLRAQIHRSLGQCYARLGQRERQLESYTRALAENSSLVEVQIDLARTLAEAGQIDQALARYRAVRNQSAVALPIARLLLAQTAARSPERQDWAAVEAALTEAAANPENARQVLLLRASVLVAKGEIPAARDMIQRAAGQQAGDVQLVAALADLTLLAGEPAEALAVLDDAEQRLGGRVEIALARARHWLRRKTSDAVEASNALEASRRAELSALPARFAALPPAEQVLLLRALAAAWDQLGEPQAASTLLDQAAALEPNDLRLWTQSLELALGAGDDAWAQRALREIGRIDGQDGVRWLLGEANRHIMLVRRGQRDSLPVARDLLERSGRQSGSAHIPLSLAEVAELEGNEAEAVARYREAIDLGHRSPHVFRRIVELLHRQRQYFEAERVIEEFRALDLVDVSDVFGRLAADVLIRTNKAEQAAELARQAVEGSETPADAVWLGHVLWAAGNTAEAETTFRNAVSQARDQAASWVSLVSFLVRNERGRDAESTIREMEQALSTDERHLALAQCYELIGRNEQAAQHYSQALETFADSDVVLWNVASFFLRSGRPADAEPLLRKLVATESRSPPALVSAARRGLALVLAAQGGHPQFQEALALVDANLADGGVPDDLRTKAQVLATRPLLGSQREALSVMLRLSDRASLTADDQFQIIRLQAALGRWTEARAGIHALLAGRPTNAEHLAFGIGQLLDRGELRGSVETWLTALATVEPESFRTAELRARRALLVGDRAQAASLLEEWMGRTRPQDSQEDAAAPERLSRVAGVLAAYGERVERTGETVAAEELFGRAEALYRRLVMAAPDQVPALIRFLGRRLRIAGALDLCESGWQAATPEAMSLVVVELLGTGRVAAGDVRRIRDWLTAARARHPENAQVAFQLAMVANAQGDYGQAEELYRGVLELEPGAVSACNDLAWLLAMRGSTREERDEALRLINQAIELAGPRDYLLDTRASVYRALGDPSRAVRDMEDAISERTTAGRQFRLALSQLAAGDEESARGTLQQATRAGLHAGLLHPLEIPDYERVRSRLGGS